MASQVPEADRAFPSQSHRRSLSGDTVLATSPSGRHAGSMPPDPEKIIDVQCLSPVKEVDSVSLSSFDNITPVLHDLTADRETEALVAELLKGELRKIYTSELRKVLQEALSVKRQGPPKVHVEDEPEPEPEQELGRSSRQQQQQQILQRAGSWSVAPPDSIYTSSILSSTSSQSVAGSAHPVLPQQGTTHAQQALSVRPTLPASSTRTSLSNSNRSSRVHFAEAVPSGLRTDVSSLKPVAGNPALPSPSPAIELNAIDQKWGRLFDDQGKATPRAEQIFQNLAQYIADEFMPTNTMVVTPVKMASFYSLHPIQSERYPFRDIFEVQTRATHERITDMYVLLGCEFHLVSFYDEQRPSVPALTPKGFAKWLIINIQASPDSEAKRMDQVVSTLPISADSLLDGKPERLPKKLSRHLLPPVADRQRRRQLDHAMQEWIDDFGAPSTRNVVSGDSQRAPLDRKRLSGAVEDKRSNNRTELKGSARNQPPGPGYLARTGSGDAGRRGGSGNFKPAQGRPPSPPPGALSRSQSTSKRRGPTSVLLPDQHHDDCREGKAPLAPSVSSNSGNERLSGKGRPRRSGRDAQDDDRERDRFRDRDRERDRDRNRDRDRERDRERDGTRHRDREWERDQGRDEGTRAREREYVRDGERRKPKSRRDSFDHDRRAATLVINLSDDGTGPIEREGGPTWGEFLSGRHSASVARVL